MDGENYGRGRDRLKDRVAIVTGAGSRADGVGNGRAAAILLARNGARVVLVDTNTEWAERTRAMIEGEGGEAIVATADVTSPEDCARIVATGVGHWGRLDILVNNVGIGGPQGTAVEVDLEGWNKGMAVNVTSMMLMAKYSIPEMIRTGGGSIVNISSVAGIRGGIANLLYPTSKGAVVNMTRAMAYHHGRDNIRVNCICPGMVYTPMVYAAGMSEEMRESRRMRSALQTEGSGWDVAGGVLYLASDDARWVTGVVLPIDAGATAISSTPSPVK
ncbi:MAG TPA: SDR family oxidoreductase [Rhodoblastus sp.]|nr:SDR family oxidoreductase [Rhodoblastus sp.]